MKNKSWRQPTPQMQYSALVMGLDGWVTLAEDKIKKPEDCIPKIREYVEQMRELIPFLEGKKKW